MFQKDTIAAIATGMTNAGIGIIRISGTEAIDIADSVFCARNPDKTLKNTPGYSALFGNICDGDCVLDEVICLVMRKPNSYTTEDVVEIQCHGGAIILQSILELLIRSGARAAEPGEFTKRAFLGGRIDITQAESVMDMIHAKNKLAAQSSVVQLQGKLSAKIRELREMILNHIAYIESALDDPENYSLEGYSESLKVQVQETIRQVGELLSTAEEGKMIKEGIRTVILGKPNAGKSSLLNCLLGEERAIVTDVAGTTRDTLEEDAVIQGIPLKIIDTAGIRQTVDIVEKMGVDKARKSVENADLILYVVDGTRELDEDDAQIMGLLENQRVIITVNKTDVEQIVDKQWITSKVDAPIVEISAKTGDGMNQLYDCLKTMFFHGKLSMNDEVYITNVRHKQALMETRNSLQQVLNSIEQQMPEDFLSIDLMAAYEQLGYILGEALEDDLADEIFSKFCMGK
ncbi:MAG: tRNA uridine-5-carboxymethylaminomethyl(34) synthesis GTPase MnmE [Bacteroides sp.]|nr:tRNA uridine-5-carboxymethylaminomethyl(34) synthesis GTPase MnmE [Bacteroides sp.]MCM1549708.1 tRNA uridine-5-carboxymethylaminomethyl(34) synthesis GTPase MnmE [Clostridium sp.]